MKSIYLYIEAYAASEFGDGPLGGFLIPRPSNRFTR